MSKDRIKVLIFLKEGTYAFQSDIAKKLERTEKTVRGWLQKYSKVGFSGLTIIKSGGNNTRVLSDKAKAFVAEKLFDSATTITSYIELKQLIAEELEEIVPYFTLYAHCRRKHKSKLKAARKPHYKKDPKADGTDEVFEKAIDDEQTIVFTDKSTSYVNIADYVEIRMSEKSSETTTKETLKWVHIVISNAKRNFVGTYHKIRKSICNYTLMSLFTSLIEDILEKKYLID